MLEEVLKHDIPSYILGLVFSIHQVISKIIRGLWCLYKVWL